MSVIKVDVAPNATNVYWRMNNEVTIVVSNSYALGGIIWTGTNGLHVISACDTQLVFTATNSVPGDYTVKAAAVLSDAYDTATVGIRKADIVQTQVGWSVGLSNNAPFNLTADSSMNVTWTITPNLGAGGAQFAAGPSVPGTASTGSGTNVWITPGTTATNYTITAYVNDLPSCQDTAKLIVISNYTIIASSTFIALSNNCVTATAWTIDASGVAVPTNSNWTIPLGNTRARFVSGASTVTSTTGVDTVTLTGLTGSATLNDVRVHAVAVGSSTLAGDEWFTVLKVDLEIYDGQDGDLVDESVEGIVGAFTVANINDSNGNGTNDVDDTDVEGEEDLMKLVIQIPVPNVGGCLSLNMSAGVKVWRSADKSLGQETATTFNVTDLPTNLWVELTAQSLSLQDRWLEIDYLGCRDKVKATGVWAEKTGFKNATSDGMWVDAGSPMTNTFASRFFGLLGIQYTNPPVNVCYGMGMEFTVFPAGVGDIPRVLFDVTRQMEKQSWAIRGPNVVSFDGPKYWEGRVSFTNVGPTGLSVDLSTDDDGASRSNSESDEDNTPTNNHIYVIDGPGHSHAGLPQQQIVRRLNLLEFVRVRFGGATLGYVRPALNTDEGSRCSMKVGWHARMWSETDGSRYHEVPGKGSEVAEGYVDILPAPTP